MIALLTDFGADNHYVAQMKARIYGEYKEATLVDITHSVSPQNIVEAAFILRDSVEAFPAGSIFVVVVDPGVGTNRDILIAESNRQLFVLPDNGLIEMVRRKFGLDRVFHVDCSRFEASSTFHGRDIMAPVVGRIGRGDEIQSLGTLATMEQIQRLKIDDPVRSGDNEGRQKIEGQIVYADRFGNLISNIEYSSLPANRLKCEVALGDIQLSGIQNTFGDKNRGEILALVGSHGRVEVAENCGNAQRTLNCEPLEKIEVVWSE